MACDDLTLLQPGSPLQLLLHPQLLLLLLLLPMRSYLSPPSYTTGLHAVPRMHVTKLTSVQETVESVQMTQHLTAPIVAGVQEPGALGGVQEFG